MAALQDKEIERQFEWQVREYELLLHKVCHIYAYTDVDRQDLFQDIVIQLWQAYPTFRGDAKFSTWLYRVAINTAITGKRRKKEPVTYFEPASLPVHIDEETGNYQQEEDRRQTLNNAIAQLNDVEKAIVMLYMENRTYEEMEEVLGIKEATLRVKMNRIKEKLRGHAKKTHYGT
jgi:RNA polymerase sigma-70 factor (ECF subfamily)